MDILKSLPVSPTKLQICFKEIDILIRSALDRITHLYQKLGIRFFVKTHHETIMRILVPQEFKIFYDAAQVMCMFENTNL